MADIIVTIPTDKLPLVKAWVDSRTNEGIVEGWIDAQYAEWVDDFITSHFRSLIYNFQVSEYQKTFVFDDPIT